MPHTAQTGSHLWVTLFCLLLFAGRGGREALGQQTTGQSEFYPLEAVPAEGEQPLEGPLHPLLREEQPIEGQPLEGAIDPQSYIMGPGDLVGVSVMSEVKDELLARVSADGTLRIETLGIFQAAGKSFAHVRDEILEAAKLSYRSKEVAVYIVELRNFKASVGGMVWAPGTYTMTATDRAVGLLARAGGFYNPQRKEETQELTKQLAAIGKKTERLAELPSYAARRAQIVHLDGTVTPVDLLLFLRAGKPEGNPYLRDGDFLLVPPLNPKSGVIEIYGSVNYQGMIEYVSGDNLERALLLAGGVTSDALRDSVEITRFSSSKSDYSTSFVNLDAPAALSLSLNADDRIFVRAQPSFHPRRQVELRGEVMKPGFFPVAEEGTRILDIIRQAGGFTARASLREATLTRQFGQELVDPEYQRLRQMSTGDMTPLEYSYFKTKSQEARGMVVLDLYALFLRADSSQNIILQHLDVLEIPPVTRSVKVTGQVGAPGIMAYAPGADYSYYIQKAGGYTWNASRGRVRVIKAVTGKWLKPGRTRIEEGDTVFIPEKPDRDYWQFYKDIMLVVTQFATIYLVIATTTK